MFQTLYKDTPKRLISDPQHSVLPIIAHLKVADLTQDCHSNERETQTLEFTNSRALF